MRNLVAENAQSYSVVSETMMAKVHAQLQQSEAYLAAERGRLEQVRSEDAQQFRAEIAAESSAIKQELAHREEEERMQALTPEEIEEMEKSIPEWKRNALVTTEQEVVEEKVSMFKRMKAKARSKFD